VRVGGKPGPQAIHRRHELRLERKDGEGEGVRHRHGDKGVPPVHAHALEATLDEQDARHAGDAQRGDGDRVKQRAAVRDAIDTARAGIVGVEANEGGDLDRGDKVDLDLLELDQGADDGGAEPRGGETALQALAERAGGLCIAVPAEPGKYVEQAAGPGGGELEAEVEEDGQADLEKIGQD
jgi:hypothetical protein